MTKTDLAMFAKLWAGMAEMYGKTVSDAAIAMAYAALEKYDLLDIRRALNAHVTDAQRGQFLAKPADLILHLDGDPASRALLAWTKAEDAMKTIGTYRPVVFDDAAIMAVIDDMGGWVEFGKMRDDEVPFKRGEFEKRYKGYINRPPLSHPSVLGGIFSLENQQHHTHKEEPVLIGNAQQAMLVHQSGGAKPAQYTPISALLESAVERLSAPASETH